LYMEGMEKLIPLKKETEEPIDLSVLTQFLNSEKTLTNWNERMRHYIPGTSFQISVDSTTINLDHSSLSYGISQLPSITWQFPKDFYGISDIVVLNIIKNNFGKRPICFAYNNKTSHLIGLSPFLVQQGMVGLLTPVKRNNPSYNPKIVDVKASYKLLVEDAEFPNINTKHLYIRDENRTYAREILRQNYYFLAQALSEENRLEESKRVLDTCIQLFPNETVPYLQYAFAIGRLYARIGHAEIGNDICLTAMNNIWQEVQWMTSFDTPYPIINVRHATKLHNMYAQMIRQLGEFNPTVATQKQNELADFNTAFNSWQKTNWPY
ncbi:MAG: hypothetical protein AAF901_09545, partial [Bacteroidota bacterium]